MIKLHRLLINSLPDGIYRELANEFQLEKATVIRIATGEFNPEDETAQKVVRRIGEIAAVEIFQFSWDEKHGE